MSAHPQTLAEIVVWQMRSHVSGDKLLVDAQRDDADTQSELHYLPNTVEITVVYGGAVDEEFTMHDMYAVNIVDDVLVPSCIKESESDGEPWEVSVYRVSGEHGDYAEPECIYNRLSSDGSESAAEATTSNES